VECFPGEQTEFKINTVANRQHSGTEAVATVVSSAPTATPLNTDAADATKIASYVASESSV